MKKRVAYTVGATAAAAVVVENNHSSNVNVDSTESRKSQERRTENERLRGSG